MSVDHAPPTDILIILRRLFVIQWTHPMNYRLIFLMIFGAFATLFIPIIEKAFRQRHHLHATIIREEGVVTYLASRLMYLTYPS
jgi:hypothetical protein